MFSDSAFYVWALEGKDVDAFDYTLTSLTAAYVFQHKSSITPVTQPIALISVGCI